VRVSAVHCCARIAILAVLFVGLTTSPALAQLSPGKLSRAHAHLSGLTNCSHCHKLGSRDVQPKCLGCHTEISTMVAEERGLHAGEDFSQCVDCHVEHQGEEYDLIYWPDGREEFAHQDTGFLLTGAHDKLKCRQCHQSRYVVDPAPLAALGKNLERTYLGLSPACDACHRDIHGGQFEQNCTSCHDVNAWKPAALFTHETTRFPLTGKHERVDCARCHRPAPATAGDEPVVRFVGVAYAGCADCHADPHAGSLGSDCRTCHTTAGWREIDGAAFDHSLTRYPLRGKHRQVRCEACHRKAGSKPAFDACGDCHRDVHDSAALQRPHLAACEDCHSVDGFRPVTYTMSRHEQSGFPLQGAHRAIPCSACHPPNAGAVAELVVAHGHCTDCHADPHPQSMTVVAPNRDPGCQSCHHQDSWRVTDFDHAPTGFPLDGRHAAVSCAGCHKSGSAVDFSGLRKTCAACHEDVHQGQFDGRASADGGQVACDECHVTVDWFAEKFDHETGSRFPLRGGHERVACTGCHQPDQADNERLLRFRPVATACRDCHDNPGPNSGDKE
jgi:predicted CXXCH cytochrome family protein